MKNYYVRPDAITADLEESSEAAVTGRLVPDVPGIPEIPEISPADTFQTQPFSPEFPDTQFLPSAIPRAYSAPGKSVVLPPRKTKKPLIIALVAIIVLVAGGCAAYFLGFFGGKPVPNVVGLQQTEAVSRLEDAGFGVVVQQVKSDDPEGIVLRTNPNAGVFLQNGANVTIEVSIPRTIPAIVGMQKDAALELLKKDGFETVEVSTKKSNEPSNTVLEVLPAEGEVVKALEKITIVVSEPFVVPETAGKSEADAKALLQAEGYVVKTTFEYTEEKPEGTVLGTNPKAGTELASGSEVVLQIAKSRASEVISLSKAWFSGAKTYVLDGTNFELRSVNSVTYAGNNSCSFSVTMRPFETHSWFGQQPETRYGADKTISGTITFAANNQFSSITPALTRQ